MDVIESQLSRCAGYGITFVVVTQDISAILNLSYPIRRGYDRAGEKPAALNMPGASALRGRLEMN